MTMRVDRAEIRRRILSNLRFLNTNAMLHGYYEGRQVRDREDLAANRVAIEKLFGMQRSGVALVVGEDQFPGELVHQVRRAQNKLAVEPAVNNLSPSVFHVTIFSLNPSFNTDMAGAEGEKGPYSGPDFVRGYNFMRYCSAIRRALSGLSPFEITFRGLGMSPAAGFIQGYDRGIINALRSDLLLALEEERLGFTDKQPEIVYCTVNRFVSDLRDPNGFVATIDGLRGREFGSIWVQKMTLVGRREEGQPFDILEEFKLPV